MRVPGVSSCIRLSALRKVDLPQPLGPMMAVTFLAGIRMVTSWSAWRGPYQRLKFLMSNATSPDSTGNAAVGAWPGAEEVVLTGSETGPACGASGRVDMAFNYSFAGRGTVRGRLY